jgi:dipeptidyl-peptidase-4
MVDVYSSDKTPPRAVVATLKGEEMGTLPLPHDPEIESLGLRTPAVFTVDSPAGVRLFGHVLAPRNIDTTRKYPLVLMVYGGPGVQTIANRWAPSLFWQHLADRGFFVAQLDNRGGSGRGQAFAAPISGRLGEIELKDQLAGLDWLETHAPIDASRVAIYGHSYGGFMALKAMFDAPTRFKAGVSASPVSDFRLYDSGYTERYLGLPDSDALGYDGTDLAKSAGKLTGKLFLIHALMDENVHFDNSARIIDALAENQKPFDLLVLPGERHGYRNMKTKEYVYRRIAGFISQALAP